MDDTEFSLEERKRDLSEFLSRRTRLTQSSVARVAVKCAELIRDILEEPESEARNEELGALRALLQDLMK